MSRKRIIVEELDDGSFSYQEIDMGNPQQLPNGQVTYPVRDGAKEGRKDIVAWFSQMVGYKEGKE